MKLYIRSYRRLSGYKYGKSGRRSWRVVCLLRFMYVTDLCSRRQNIACALLLLQKETFVLSYAALYIHFKCQSKVVAPIFPFPLHFCVVIFILLNLFSSWICMKCLRLDVKQTIINKSTISGTKHFLTGERLSLFLEENSEVMQMVQHSHPRM